MGERAALVGYGSQYEVAAGLVLETLTAESFEFLTLQDPKAGQLDDFHLATPGRLDAYQIKWSDSGGQLPWGKLRSYLLGLIIDRRRLAKRYSDRTVLGHLYTNLVASNARIKGTSKRNPGATLANLVAQILQPATKGNFTSVASLPIGWRPLLRDLAGRCGLSQRELLGELRFLRLELGQALPTQASWPIPDLTRYVRHLNELKVCLLNSATQLHPPIHLSRESLLGRLGPDWKAHLTLRSLHEFPTPLAYQPVVEAVDRLVDALGRFTSGYVALIGSPGSGKSTLLTHELQGRDDVVARYYADVPDRPDIGATRSDPGAFLHDLVLTLERAGLPRGPTPPDFDVTVLSERLSRHLQRLGEQYLQDGRRSLILVDGLDHVERERGTDQSLLRYLPLPRGIPDGVLFVIGSQTYKMLHSEIRGQLEEAGRTIMMALLERRAVTLLAKAWRIAADPDRLWEVSGGHPLILTYLLKELRDLPGPQQKQRLAATPRYAGDVEALYRCLWAAVENEHELVEFLALVSRMRGSIDLAWLGEHGQPPAVIRRLRDTMTHLFRTERDRWKFFHPSFRQFLQERTAFTDGKPNSAENRRLHGRLAEMCRATLTDDPRSWDLVFHLAKAEQHSEVLQTGTPGYFRAQYLALRPAGLITSDIRIAAESLRVVHDPMALVRLTIASTEVSQRRFHLPDEEEFVSLLVRTGQWRTALEHMEAEHERFGAEDYRTARLRISLLLLDEGHDEDARQLFLANEPLELFRGKPGHNRPRSAYNLLDAWARAAAVLRGADAVLETVYALQVPAESWETARGMDPTALGRAWVLAAAADEMDARANMQDADRLQDALARTDSDTWVRCLSWCWRRSKDSRERLLPLVTQRFHPGDLSDENRVLVSEALWWVDKRHEAAVWVDGLAQPPLPDPGSLGNLWQDERHRRRLNRLLAALGQRSDPTKLVPAREHDWQRTSELVARVSVTIAQLEGRAWAKECFGADDFLGFAGPVLRIFESEDLLQDRLTSHGLSKVRPHALARLLFAAGQHGRDAVSALWKEYERRWSENPTRLVEEGHQVLPVALGPAYITRGAIIARLREMETIVQRRALGGDAPTDLMHIAETMVMAGLKEDARRLLGVAVSKTLAIYHRKDYQLSEWIDRLGPRLDGDSGADLVRWLAGALVQMCEYVEDRPVNDAARRLLCAESARRPGHAWQVGGWLQHRHIVDWDDRLIAFLEAQIDLAADQRWWTVLTEEAVPIAADPPRSILEDASRRAKDARGVAWLSQRLQALAKQIEIEAPPRSRGMWRATLADRAAESGIPLGELGLPDDLHPDCRQPPSHAPETDWQQRDSFLAAHRTVASVLEDAHRTGGRSDLQHPWHEALESVAGRMSLSEVQEALTIFPPDDLQIRFRLARRAFDLEAFDVVASAAGAVVKSADTTSWLPGWDGGVVFAAMCLLARIDPEGTREMAYLRFASAAVSENILVPRVLTDSNELLDLFGVNDRDSLGREVEDYIRHLLEAPLDQPPTDQPNSDEDAFSTMARTGFDLLASPYRLAVVLGQRALIAGMQAQDPHVETLLVDALNEGDEETVLRVLSVVETAIHLGARPGKPVEDALGRWTAAEHLGLRLASRRLGAKLGCSQEPQPYRDLSPVYSLVIPRPSHPVGLKDGRFVGRDSLEAILPLAEENLRRLADATGMDLAVLNARTESLARILAGGKEVDDRRWMTSDSCLGFSYHKPSLILWQCAAARVAAELADAGMLPHEKALLLSIGPMYDSLLIGSRPATRPDAIVRLPERQEDWVKAEQWLDGLRGAEERLARSLSRGWTVIGERTELRRLERGIPREQRMQGFGTRRKLHPDSELPLLRGLLVTDLANARSIRRWPLIYHEDFGFRGPSSWLTLHPALAEACGWERDREYLLAWRDSSGTVVRSFWWRSGWLDSTNWYDHEEVGEGWLVLARDDALKCLAQVMGGELAIAWQLVRSFREGGHSSKAQSGVRTLLCGE
jgi:hypothetical protein